MASSKNIKKILATITWFIVGGIVVFGLVAAMQRNKNTICIAVKVNILSNQEQLFLTEKNIETILNTKEIVNIKKVAEIDIKSLENQLEKNIWIENVELFFDKENVLHVEVVERVPFFRIFRQNGNSFYMDSHLFTLPLSNAYSAKVPFFTGFGNNTIFNKGDSTTLECVAAMANFINNNAFWMAQIQQINILQNDEFEITPTIGNHNILFGDTTDMQNKFQKLFQFYKAVSTKVGFDKYAILNVKFKNQIVATTTDNEVIDTSKASQVIQNFIKGTIDSATFNMDTTSTRNAMQNIDTARRRTVVPTLARPVTTTIRPRITQTNATRRQNNNNITNNQPKPRVVPRAVMPKRPTTTPRRNN